MIRRFMNGYYYGRNTLYGDGSYDRAKLYQRIINDSLVDEADLLDDIYVVVTLDETYYDGELLRITDLRTASEYAREMSIDLDIDTFVAKYTDFYSETGFNYIVKYTKGEKHNER